MERTVRNLLSTRPSGIFSVRPEASVLEVVRTMSEKHVGALAVMDGARLAGIVSERDIARKVVLEARDPASAQVHEIMTERVIYVRPDQDLSECAALMIDKGIRHLPVLDGERVVGMLSIRDVVRAVIDEQRFLIQQLEFYITGGPVPG